MQAHEPFFRLGLRRLEAANGHPGADIRLSTEVMQATRAKLKELGLDPADTTPQELYHVLQERMQADDARLVKTLRTRAATHISAEGDVVAGMIHALKALPETKRCFALKSSAFRSIIKKLPPKKALKQLGYRSLDSCLKHELPVSLMAAAWLTEGRHWQRRLLDQYKRLQPSDFEERNISLVQLNSPRWQRLARTTVTREKHNLLSFKELGALAFLPLETSVPAGVTTASLALSLHDLNEIRASSTFLKLCLVRPDFGDVVQTIVRDEPYLNADMLDQSVPWHLIHRYYAQMKQRISGVAFEPHLQIEDIAWHPVEAALSTIEPSFRFWQQSAHLGLLHEKQPVSMNIIDVALNCCNHMPFEQRIVQYFQHSLWHELLLRYLQREPVEQAVAAVVQPSLAAEMAIAE